jgi:cation transport ATPase
MKSFAAALAAVLIVTFVCASLTVEAQQGVAVSGKVVETMDSGGYTYVRVEKKGRKTWVAVPTTTVKVGDTVTFKPGMEMKDFESKTLKRTFDRIIFSGGIAK